MLWETIGNQPFLTVIVVYIVTHGVFLCCNRIVRGMNLRKLGWPPPHCDGDGDFRPEKDDDDEA